MEVLLWFLFVSSFLFCFVFLNLVVFGSLEGYCNEGTLIC